jgi:chloramphenicol-sensitive protein RarD
MSAPAKDDPKGILLAGSAYVFWGIMPLYWRLLLVVPPFELATHRLFWSALFVALVSLFRGRVRHLLHLARQPRVVATLAVTAILISINWSIYIYCVANNQLVEASLGYYINPLLSILLGVMFLGEHISRMRAIAIALAAFAVVMKSVALGHFSWIAISLALSFGFYGYLRKTIFADPLDTLAIETWILFPVTAALIAWWGLHETAAFPHTSGVTDTLLVLGGPLTALPLAMFAAGVQRIRLSTLGFLQYLNPTITLLLATLGFGEHFTRVDLLTFAIVGIAIVIVLLDSRFGGVKQPEAVSEPEPA